jgi:spermidine synthase
VALTRPWQTIDSLDTDDGRLDLRTRGAGDFLLCLDGRILMNSRESRSEEALGVEAATAVAGRREPRLLVAGLGMGITLRAALSELDARASVVVAELQPRIGEWCRGPLADLCGDALEDSRVDLRIADVRAVIREAALPSAPAFDAIALDLYEGVRPGDDDSFFGSNALAAARAALTPGGVLARWTEQLDPGFEQRLAAAGFAAESRRIGRGGRRHVVYTARRADP